MANGKSLQPDPLKSHRVRFYNVRKHGTLVRDSKAEELARLKGKSRPNRKLRRRMRELQKKS